MFILFNLSYLFVYISTLKRTLYTVAFMFFSSFYHIISIRNFTYKTFVFLKSSLHIKLNAFRGSSLSFSYRSCFKDLIDHVASLTLIGADDRRPFNRKLHSRGGNPIRCRVPRRVGSGATHPRRPNRRTNAGKTCDPCGIQRARALRRTGHAPGRRRAALARGPCRPRSLAVSFARPISDSSDSLTRAFVEIATRRGESRKELRKAAGQQIGESLGELWRVQRDLVAL